MTNKEKSKIQKEILEGIGPNPIGRLFLAPRVGKSKLAIDIIKRDKPKSILWVTPEVELAEVDIPKEFVKWRAKKYLSGLTTSTWMSLNKVQGHFDLILLDEEQNITINNAKNLLNGSLSGNIITMTGTPSKSWKKNNIYDRLGLKILYHLSIKDAVDIGLLSNYTINVVMIPMSKENNILAGNKIRQFYTSEQKQYNWINNVTETAIYKGKGNVKILAGRRRNIIKNSPSKHKVAEDLIRTLKGRLLIFASSIEQAEKLSYYTYHSKTDSEDYKRFQNGEIDLIALVNAGGVGRTYKGIDHLILVQSDSDVQGLTSQKITRTLLAQDNYKATIWILCLEGTRDEDWVKSALSNFHENKIHYINLKEQML